MSARPTEKQLDAESDGHAVSEQRDSARTLTVCRVVRIEHDGNEGLARCRNISDTGMRLDLAMPIALHDTITMVFSPHCRLTGRVVWSKGHECGVAFDEKIDSAALLSMSAAEVRADGYREPRLALNLRARLRWAGYAQKTTISDISQHGMKLTHDGTLQRGLYVQVELGDGRHKVATVRWVRGNLAGLFLLEPFGVDDLGSINTL